MTEESLTTVSMPPGELRYLVDMMIWDMSHRGRPSVEAWLAELRARPDVGSEDVQRTISVCLEYLAEPA